MKPNIFCDLDGVLVDFEGGFFDVFEIIHDTIPESEMWSKILSTERWWHNLPALTDAMTLWNFIVPYNPIILTGCPKTGYEHAEAGKHHWVDTTLGTNVPRIMCRSKDKPIHMIKPGDILIDDMKKNCDRWVKAGGIAIRHRSSYETINQLKEILNG